LDPWLRALAERALGGYVAKSVGEATHYHADYVVPYWLSSLSKVAKVGTHIFYRWPGSFGTPAAFTGRYAGGEPLVGGDLLLASAKTAQPAEEEVRPVEMVVASAQATIEIAAPVIVRETESKTLSAPAGLTVKEIKHEAPFAVRGSCANSTLGNCMNF
jgi:hypothetical protein